MEKKRITTPMLCVTAMFMALTVATSSFSIPVPGGHLYFCDAVICTAAILLDPVLAFIAGGVGSFIGDMLFYPAPMFVSLASHGLQALIASLCVRKLTHMKPITAGTIGVVVGGIVSVIGYTLGRAFVYATVESAIVKLPFALLQAGVGAVIAVVLCYKFHLITAFEGVFSGKLKKSEA